VCLLMVPCSWLIVVCFVCACVCVLEVEPASMCVGAGSFFWCVGFLCVVWYCVYMKNYSGKGINPGPSTSPLNVNSKPTGGGRVGPALVYAENPHPKAGKAGRTGKVSDAMKGWS